MELAVRPVSLPRSSLPSFLDSTFPGNSLRTWEFHPLKLSFCRCPGPPIIKQGTHSHTDWKPHVIPPHYNIPHYTILYYTILYDTIRYDAIRYDTIRYDAILYYTKLHYTILSGGHENSTPRWRRPRRRLPEWAPPRPTRGRLSEGHGVLGFRV